MKKYKKQLKEDYSLKNLKESVKSLKSYEWEYTGHEAFVAKEELIKFLTSRHLIYNLKSGIPYIAIATGGEKAIVVEVKGFLNIKD